MIQYSDYNINQKINAKNNEVVEWAAKVDTLMRKVKKGHVISSGSRLKLEPDGINSNRNYDGPYNND
jgi:hypothetical protein